MYHTIIIITSIKLKDEVGMAGLKSTQTRFVRHKHLLYIPLLAFLDYYAPINVDVFVECGMWETFRGCSLVVTMVQDII